MIPRTGPKVETLPPLKLYREDLEKLFSLFREHCQQVSVGDEEHVYESLAEMEERTPARLRCFAISGLIPHAELVVRGSHSVPLAVQRSTLWIVERNPKSDLLFLSAKELLQTRRWISRIILRITAFAVAAVLFIACLFSKSLLGTHHTGSDLGYNLTVLVAFGLFVVGVLMNTKRVSYITLRLRSKSQSFWDRNSDHIAMTLLGTLIGVLGTLAVEWLKRVLSK